MNALRRLHGAAGVLTLIVFLVTGAYMKLRAHPERLPDGPHLLFVSRHIYILAGALVHLALAAYAVPSKGRGRRAVQGLGSGLLTVSSVFLVGAFVFEAIGGRGRTFVSSLGLYTLAGGVLLHVVTALQRNSRA